MKEDLNDYFIKRLIQLRKQRSISARHLSRSIHRTEDYINKIENGKRAVTLDTLYSICEYFHILPKDFFDDEMDDPELTRDVIEDLKKLDHDQLAHVSALIKYILKE